MLSQNPNTQNYLGFGSLVLCVGGLALDEVDHARLNNRCEAYFDEGRKV
jgi:hypothetical protein